MIKIAICDDEKYFVDTVEKMLKIYAEKNGKDFCNKKIYKAIAVNGIFKRRIPNFLFGYRDACDGWYGTGRYHPQT